MSGKKRRDLHGRDFRWHNRQPRRTLMSVGPASDDPEAKRTDYGDKTRATKKVRKAPRNTLPERPQ